MERPEILTPGELALIQFDDWFFAPDGQEYRCAFGPVHIVKAEEILGFQPKGSANWFAQVGTGERTVYLAGCRIHVVSPCSAMPVAARSIWDAREAA